MFLRRIIAFGISLGLVTLACLVLTFSIAWITVSSEGYKTTGAAWNYLIRRGEIRFQFKDGYQFTEISSMDKTGVIDKSNEGYVRLGYGVFTTDVKYTDRDGLSRSLSVTTNKFNDWNRVLYTQDTNGELRRHDNGVFQEVYSIPLY